MLQYIESAVCENEGSIGTSSIQLKQCQACPIW